MEYLEKYDILTNAQHAFCKARSTEMQLILTIHDLSNKSPRGFNPHPSLYWIRILRKLPVVQLGVCYDQLESCENPKYWIY